MKYWIISIITVIVVFGSVYWFLSHQKDQHQKQIAEAAMLEEQAEQEKEAEERKIAFDRIKSKADSAKLYCEKKGFNTDFCYLVDFKIHSGKNRFFVWDFAKDTISDAGLCCHGYGKQGKRSTGAKPVFSNEVGSLCSSLGHYQVVNRDVCRYGTLFQYRLQGLDATNSNAFERCVTLHSYGAIPDSETYPTHIPLGYSQGCTIVSDNMLHRLDTLQKSSKKSVLLWAYNE